MFIFCLLLLVSRWRFEIDSSARMFYFSFASPQILFTSCTHVPKSPLSLVRDGRGRLPLCFHTSAKRAAPFTGSVTTSLKSLANSLGLKRAFNQSKTFPSPDPEMEKRAVPYSSIPASASLPRTEADISMADGDASLEVPGGPSRPGVPAPPNARLSTGEGVTTTIRLISAKKKDSLMSPPKLQPMQPTFDLVMSPGTNSRVSVWPPSPGTSSGRIYPSLDAFMAADNVATGPQSPVASPAPALSGAKRASLMPTNEAQDIFSPHKQTAKARPSNINATATRSEPFLFGSPLPADRPRTSNADFELAAASVLSEMNKRLAESGVQGVDANLLTKKIPASTGVFGSPLNPTRQRTDSTTDRFAKAHEDAFAKMDSIATHYAARRGVPAASGSDATAQEPQSKKRKSEALGLGPAPGPSRRKTSAQSTRVISNGVRKNMGIPGEFGDDEDDEEQEQEREGEEEDAGDRRSSKRIRVGESQDVHKGKRVSLLATVKGIEDTDEDRAKEERKREATKRRLNEARARRRSSRGRSSIGTKAVPGNSASNCFGYRLVANFVSQSNRRLLGLASSRLLSHWSAMSGIWERAEVASRPQILLYLRLQCHQSQPQLLPLNYCLGSHLLVLVNPVRVRTECLRRLFPQMEPIRATRLAWTKLALGRHPLPVHVRLFRRSRRMVTTNPLLQIGRAHV